MATQSAPLLAFNRGVISPLGLSRIDLQRLALAAELQTNWVPRVLGSMTLRPGFKFLGGTHNNAKARYFDAVFSHTDKVLLEFTDSIMRVWRDDAVVTRPVVTTVTTNGNFTSNVTGWTDADQTGAASSWQTGGYLALKGTDFSAAIRRQSITVSAANQNKLHALRIIVTLGRVYLRVGTTTGGQEYVTEQTLEAGIHSIAFTPTTAALEIQLSGRTLYETLVDSINFEAGGILTLPTPWTLAIMPAMRYEQSADVIWVASDRAIQQRRIEKRSNDSWSIILYQPEDGPYRSQNLLPRSIGSSATRGDVSLSADDDIFHASHVGAIFKLESGGQLVTAALTGDQQFSDYVKVTGVNADRDYVVKITGTWSGTIRLQRSIGEVGGWTSIKAYTANIAADNINDSLDNSIVYLRIGFELGDYTSGTATVSIQYDGGSITGVVRVTAFTDSQNVDGVVLKQLGGTAATMNWSEGAWSDYRGYPTSVALFDGRLSWQGLDNNTMSVSDAFASFDPDVEGDSGPIIRSIGSGPVDTINWTLPLQRLILGGGEAEHSVRSSSFDEPLTPTNYSVKPCSTLGSANVEAVIIDKTGIFVEKSGEAIFELSTANNNGDFDYSAEELTLLAPEITDSGVTRMAVQRRPDTRLHVVCEDGHAAILIRNQIENVRCWIRIAMYFNTDLIEDVVTLPGTKEDQVYYAVSLDGVRYLAKWATEAECVGGDLNKQADMFVEYSGSPVNSLSGLSHLEGREVVVWGDGKDLGSFTVSGGSISFGAATYSNLVAGVTYLGIFKSAKLATTTTITRKKIIDHIALNLVNTHYQGLKFGPSFEYLDSLPLVENGAKTDADTIWESYDQDSIEFPGEWNSDSRLCLLAQAPRPCTISAAIITITS